MFQLITKDAKLSWRQNIFIFCDQSLTWFRLTFCRGQSRTDQAAENQVTESYTMSEPNPEGRSFNSTNKDNDIASQEALAARFAEDKERFKMTEEEKDEAFRCVRRLFVIDGKMTQEECDEIERRIAAEKEQKEDQEKKRKEECQ